MTTFGKANDKGKWKGAVPLTEKTHWSYEEARLATGIGRRKLWQLVSADEVPVLHQATRELDADGRIVATPEDYARVRGLVADLIAEGVEATVPKIVRETVEGVRKLLEAGDEDRITNKALAEELDIDKGAASRRVRTAINRGYLKNLEERKGLPARLVLGENMPQDAEILPAPEDLKGTGTVALLTTTQERKNTPPPRGTRAEQDRHGCRGEGEG